MSRYVDVDKLGIGRANPDAFESKNYADGWNSVISILEKADAEDLVKVVHCKDCQYFLDKQRKNHQGICMCGEKDTSYAADFYPYADDFCSYGERKDKE